VTVSILYEDDEIVVVDKPRDIHVHPAKLSRRERSLQDILKDQRGTELYPAHRLDRPVGGILVIAKNSEIAGLLGRSLRTRDGWDKRYLCVVRGWMEGSGIIDRPMRQAPGKPEREAVTRWTVLARGEGSWSDGMFPTSRYSLVECTLETGRYHQIRRHLSVASHPILGDVSHGDNPRNRIWRDRTGLEGLMLRAHRLAFLHPVSGRPIRLTAPPDARFVKAARLFHWEEHLVLD
jgi:tRNA pseudouridine65 synthase